MQDPLLAESEVCELNCYFSHEIITANYVFVKNLKKEKNKTGYVQFQGLIKSFFFFFFFFFKCWSS